MNAIMNFNRLLKPILTILFPISFFLSSVSLHAQEKPGFDHSEFLVIIEVENDDLLKLTCQEGCVWIELTFSCPAGSCEQSVNKYGMASILQDEAGQSNDNDSDFNITIQRDSEQLLLFCNTGCAWKELEFNTPPTGEFQAFNQMGMTSIRP